MLHEDITAIQSYSVSRRLLMYKASSNPIDFLSDILYTQSISNISSSMEIPIFSKPPRKDSHGTTEDFSKPQRFILAKSCSHPFQGFAREWRLHETKEVDSSRAKSPIKLWIGLSMITSKDHIVKVGIVCHDGTEPIDFAVYVLHVQVDGYDQHEPSSTLNIEQRATELNTFFIDTLREVARANTCKFVGAGVCSKIVRWSPQLPARLWTELDILPITLDTKDTNQDASGSADSMARNCIM
jgi:hypothetical protein